MLCVSAEPRPSAIHGLGLFLLAPVKKGELIWRFDSRIDRIYSGPEFELLPKVFQSYMKMYAHYHKPTNLWMLCGDYASFTNHSDDPTNESLGPVFADDIAVRDLAVGTELTTNYKEICDYTRETGNFAPP